MRDDRIEDLTELPVTDERAEETKGGIIAVLIDGVKRREPVVDMHDGSSNTMMIAEKHV
jgi:hypothetical protein